jgi:hypothetical protein
MLTALLVCQVGDRAGWKSADHPLRQPGAGVQLTCIPTLVHMAQWGDDGPLPGRRLDVELEACETEAQVAQLVAQLLQSP